MKSVEINQEAEFEETGIFIEKTWGITPILGMEDYGNKGYYGGVVKVICGKTSYAYKLFPTNSEIQSRFITNTLVQLESNNFTNFPKVIPTLNGEYYVKTSGGSFGVLSAWIDGGPISDREPSDSKKRKVRDLAEKVAQFHATLDLTAPDKNTLIDETMSGSWVPEMIERFEKARNIAEEENNLFGETYLLSVIKQFLLECKPIIDVMSNLSELTQVENKLSKGIVHNDLWIGHWFFSPDGKPYILDFDRLRYGRRIDDIERLISESMRLGDEYGKLALDGYRKNANIEQYDITQLPLFIRYGIVRRTLWLINEYLKRGANIDDQPLSLSKEIKRSIDIMHKNIEVILGITSRRT